LQLVDNYREQIELKNEEFSNVLSYQALFLKEIKLMPILLSLLEQSGKVGKSAKVLIDEIKEQYKEFNEKFKNEEKFIEDYLENTQNQKGNINEMDSYSSIVSDLLSRLSEKDPDKESVLIIDDLDRLDPEHIFRLFNIFSVNFGKEEIQNKFGFDKIIFVCDLGNIRKIYQHRYGKGVDFEGYINKFYSNYPFKFDTNQFLSKYVVELLERFHLPTSYIDFSDKRNLSYYSNYTVLKGIINSLIIFRKINLRTLLNSTSFTITDKLISFDKKRKFHSSQLPLITIFKILVVLFDSKEVLEEILEDLSRNFHVNSFINSSPTGYDNAEGAFNTLIEMSIPFITNYSELEILTHDMGNSDDKNISLEVDNFGFLIHFTVSRNFSSYNDNDFKYRFKNFSDKTGSDAELEVNPYLILLSAFKKSNSLHML
ncbi:MAG: hypothetical protein LC122_14800, partial [Chitinophagales bacterium]|nr:hypothetical protein [Chitinophagales bacterium]